MLPLKTMKSAIKVEKLTKYFDKNVAVDQVSFKVGERDESSWRLMLPFFSFIFCRLPWRCSSCSKGRVLDLQRRHHHHHGALRALARLPSYILVLGAVSWPDDGSRAGLSAAVAEESLAAAGQSAGTRNHRLRALKGRRKPKGERPGSVVFEKKAIPDLCNRGASQGRSVPVE